MAGIASAPCRSLAAKDIRDLQCRTGHGRGPLRRRRGFPLFLGLLRGSDSRSSGLSIRAIMPVATRV